MDAEHGDLPHQVSLYSTALGRHFCGASIIHPFLILTAAHCFGLETHKPPNVLVKAGLSSQTGGGRDNTGQMRSATHLFVHQNWNNITFDNDIAILVLNQALDFNEYVKPIQLRDPSWELPGAILLSLNNLRTFGTTTKKFMNF